MSSQVTVICVAQLKQASTKVVSNKEIRLTFKIYLTILNIQVEALQEYIIGIGAH